MRRQGRCGSHAGLSSANLRPTKPVECRSSSDDVGMHLILDVRNPVAQDQLSLFQSLDLELIAGDAELQSFDRTVEVTVLLFEAAKLRMKILGYNRLRFFPVFSPHHRPDARRQHRIGNMRHTLTRDKAAQAANRNKRLRFHGQRKRHETCARPNQLVPQEDEKKHARTLTKT